VDVVIKLIGNTSKNEPSGTGEGWPISENSAVPSFVSVSSSRCPWGSRFSWSGWYWSIVKSAGATRASSTSRPQKRLPRRLVDERERAVADDAALRHLHRVELLAEHRLHRKPPQTCDGADGVTRFHLMPSFERASIPERARLERIAARPRE
jgi:hypothetical protein